MARSEQRRFVAVTLMVTGVVAGAYLWLWHAQRREKWEYAAAHSGEPLLRPGDRGPCWSVDGTTIYFTSNRGLPEDDYRSAVFAVSSGGGDLRRITPWGYLSPSRPVEERFLIVRAPASGADGSHYLLDVTSGRMVPIALHTKRAMAFGGAESELIVARGREEGAPRGIYRYDLAADGTVSGRERIWSGEVGWAEPAVSPDGTRLAMASFMPPDEGVLTVLDLRERREVGNFRRRFTGPPQWLADSRRLLADCRSGPLTCNVETREVVPCEGLIALRDRHRPPDFGGSGFAISRDGRDRVVLAVAKRRRPDTYGVYLAVANLDGSGYRQITSNRPWRVPYVFAREQEGVPAEG